MATRLRGGGAAGAVGAITVLGLLAIFVIGGYEGRRLYSYKDILGIWTACDGETLGIKPGMKFTNEQCDKMFIDGGLARHERALRRCLDYPDVVPVKVYIAMLSLAYNIGEGGFCKSSIARKWNAGQQYAACDAFLRYNKGGNRVIKGLVIRRKGERAFCVDGLNEPVTINYENDVPPEQRDVLRRGDRGFWVEHLQRSLGVNKVDGRFETTTEALVKNFQANHGLVVDGVVDAKTWARLDGAGK